MMRYADAYKLGRWLMNIGDTLIAVGSAVGLTTGFCLLAWTWVESPPYFQDQLITAGFGGAITVAGLALGTLAAVQGRILRALLDTAVNTSSLLSAQDRAMLLGVVAPEAAYQSRPAPPEGAMEPRYWRGSDDDPKTPSPVAALLAEYSGLSGTGEQKVPRRGRLDRRSSHRARYAIR